MLKTYPDSPETASDGGKPHPAATWIDLLDPSDGDARLVAEVIGLHVPTRREIEEIEASSRLFRRDGALYLSMPMVRRTADAAPDVSPLGFVLTRERLVSVRFAALPSFDTFAAACHEDSRSLGSGPDVLTGLLEAVIDRVADVLENVSAELDGMSRSIFHADDGAVSRPKQANDALRLVLRRVGQVGDLISKLRDMLLGIGRIIPYVQTNAAQWLSPDTDTRLKSARQDVTSLSDYEAHLAGKVQFLLDATLGFINIEQNNIIKVLTVVSVVGVPPTLVASIYGMNFKNMPELDWAWGYPYGLTLVAGSALLSLLWFKLRGWL